MKQLSKRVISLSALVFGCSSSGETDSIGAGDGLSDSGPGDGASSAAGVDAFCRRFAEAFADYLDRCGCGEAAARAFREELQTLCEPTGFFGELSQALDAGHLFYDGEAAEALFARLEEPSPLCVEELYRALKMDSSEVYSFAGVFTGTHEIGSPCTLPVSYKGGISDCRDGVCAPDGAGGGICIALVGEGQACDASGDHNFTSAADRLCFDTRLPDGDGEYESAFDSLSCHAAPGEKTRVCRRGLADGELCSSHDVCDSGLCVSTGVPHEGSCTAKLVDGEVCGSHRDCRSGVCENGDPRTCGAPLADGEPCEYRDEACASGSCNDPDGNGGVCGPPPTRDLGEACSSSFDCISEGHGGSRDRVCYSGRCVADVCVAHLP